jgi:hypothetical protein
MMPYEPEPEPQDPNAHLVFLFISLVVLAVWGVLSLIGPHL